MDSLPPQIQTFLQLAGGSNIDYTSVLLLHDLTRSCKQLKRTVEDELKLIKYVLQNPSLITEQIKDFTVFDFFYDKAIKTPQDNTRYQFWSETLTTIMDQVTKLEHKDVIIYNKKYFYGLQSNARNHNELFKFMTAFTDFDMGDLDFLVYSIVARDELEKLRILSNIVSFDPHTVPAIFDTALKFGRHRIIEYLVNDYKLNPNDFGKVIDLVNYKHSHRYVYYCIGLRSYFNDPQIHGSEQDYKKAIELILTKGKYNHPVTLKTLTVWSDTARDRQYQWDNIDFKEIVDILRPKLKEPIPLDHDFGSFNEIVFGKEWSQRSSIIGYCQKLEHRLEIMEDKYNALLRHCQGQRNELSDNTDIDIDPF